MCPAFRRNSRSSGNHPVSSKHAEKRFFGRKPDSGLVSLEFGMLLPVLLLFIFGTIEMGNMFRAWLTIQKAAQTGARFATTGQGEEEGTRIQMIVDKTSQLISTLPSGTTVIEVKSWPGMDTGGAPNEGDAGGPCDTVQVVVSYDYEPITPIVGSLMSSPIVLDGSDMKVNEPWHPCEY